MTINSPTRKITLSVFISELADLLKPMMISDMVWQEELFEMQEKIARLIADGSNSDCSAAKMFVKKWPEFFDVVENGAK